MNKFKASIIVIAIAIFLYLMSFFVVVSESGSHLGVKPQTVFLIYSPLFELTCYSPRVRETVGFICSKTGGIERFLFLYRSYYFETRDIHFNYRTL